MCVAKSGDLPLAVGEDTPVLWSGAWLGDQLFRKTEEGNWARYEKAKNWITWSFKVALI